MTKDVAEAVRFYKLAADQGRADAQYILGVHSFIFETSLRINVRRIFLIIILHILIIYYRFKVC